MSCQVSVTFPPSLSYSSISSNLINGIIGTSFIVIKFPNTKEVVLYTGLGTVTDNLSSGAQSISTVKLLNINKRRNILTGQMTYNYIKLSINGILVTIENTTCIKDEDLILKIPDSSDSEIVYQSYLTLDRFQGTLIFEYSYGNNNFTIQSIYFNTTKNSFYKLIFETTTS